MTNTDKSEWLRPQKQVFVLVDFVYTTGFNNYATLSAIFIENHEKSNT